MENIIVGILGSMGVISGLMVLKTRNPVNSVFYLVLVFVAISGILISIGAEFLGVVYIVVYVGAIAVLFLFVVMMLNVKVIEINESLVKYIPIGGILGVLFVAEVLDVYKEGLGVGEYEKGTVEWIKRLEGVINVQSIGEILYTYYVYAFLLAGLVLLVAMIGTIKLTLHHYKEVKRQEVYEQVARSHSNAIRYKR